MSTDNTRNLIAQFIEQHANVQNRLITLTDRQHHTALNLGIEAARNDVIIRVDALQNIQMTTLRN